MNINCLVFENIFSLFLIEKQMIEERERKFVGKNGNK